MSLRIAPGYALRRRAFSLDEKPAVPHAYDDEFEGGVLDPKWTKTGSGGWNDVTPLDPYASFTTGGARWSLDSYRKSWLMVQPQTTGTSTISQAVTLPTDCFVWARKSFNFRYSAVVNNDINTNLIFRADANNYVTVLLNETDTNTIQCEAGVVVAGVGTTTIMANVGPQSAGTDSLCQPACYVGIQKLGTTYNFYLGYPNGNWVALAPQTHASTMTTLEVSFANVSSAAPGNMLIGIDFVRFYAGRYLP